MKNRTGLYVIVAVLVIFGAYLLAPTTKKTPPSGTPTATGVQSTEITYKGVDGKNAMELLKATHQVETKPSSFGDMVVSIDGTAADASHFWAFYINDKPATVGADAYKTTNSDQISWRLDPIQQ